MIVCADDFGLAPDIDRAVIELARLGRISAVSCLVAAPTLDLRAVRLLAELSPPVDLGLHLAFTHEAVPLAPAAELPGLTGSAGGFLPFSALVRRCLWGRLDATVAVRETRAQYAHFVSCVGRPPDFVDGHLHVQQLPGIRDGVIDFLASIEPAHRPFVRNSATTIPQAVRQKVAIAKTLAIGWYGDGFRRRVLAAGLPTNSVFGGIYAYRHYRRFPDFLGRFVTALDRRDGVLMVHPGLELAWRRKEYLTLREADWLSPLLNRIRVAD